MQSLNQVPLSCGWNSAEQGSRWVANTTEDLKRGTRTCPPPPPPPGEEKALGQHDSVPLANQSHLLRSTLFKVIGPRAGGSLRAVRPTWSWGRGF